MIADFDTAAVVVAVVAGVVPTAVVGLGVAAVAVAARHLNSAVVRFAAANDAVAIERLRSNLMLQQSGDLSSRTIGRGCRAKA